jgi:hypothetical protein
MFQIYSAYDNAKYEDVLRNVKREEELREYGFTHDAGADKAHWFDRVITGLRSMIGLKLNYNSR